MKTSGVSCETKFGLLVFLGHPNVEDESETNEPLYPSKASDGLLAPDAMLDTPNSKFEFRQKGIQFNI